MKNVLLIIFLLSIVHCFGQKIDTTRVAELKSSYSKIKSMIDSYSNLTEAQKTEVKDSCTIAKSLYIFLKAKGMLKPEDNGENYDVDSLCTKFQALQKLTGLKKGKNQIKTMIYDYNHAKKMIERIEGDQERDSIKEVIKEMENSINLLCAKNEEEKQLVEKFEDLKGQLANLELSACGDFKRSLENNEPKKFIIVGNSDPIDAKELFTKEASQRVFYDVLEIESRTSLGTFQIPSENASITLFVNSNLKRGVAGITKRSERFISLTEYSQLVTYKSNDSTDKGIGEKDFQSGNHLKKIIAADPYLNKKGVDSVLKCLPQKVYFKSISFEIKEGGIVDIRLLTTDSKGLDIYFESHAPVSLLNYTRISDQSFLHFSHKFGNNDNEKNYPYKLLDFLKIRVSDVLNYQPNVGNNFVPEDVSLTLPKDSKKEESGNDKRSYELINDSSLKRILDLRSYTDFLGLFGDQNNGIFQIEGKADFFVNPFNFSRTSITLFKKVTPYVRYSRLDNENDFIVVEGTSAQDRKLDPRRLELIERSNLELGFELNYLNFRLFKESPVWISFTTPLRYYYTKVRPVDTSSNQEMNSTEQVGNDDESELVDENFNTVSYGPALNFELRRLNNFGFNLGLYWIRNNFLGNIKDLTFSDPKPFWTFSMDGEVFFYPGENPNQSIFLRIRTFQDLNNPSKSFNQLQFGYRFTLGLGNRKAKD